MKIQVFWDVVMSIGMTVPAYYTSSARFLTTTPLLPSPPPPPKKKLQKQDIIFVFTHLDTLHLAPLQRPIHLGDPAASHITTSIAPGSLKQAIFSTWLYMGRQKSCCLWGRV